MRGASDKCHFFYHDFTNQDGKHRSLTSGDSLGSIETTVTTPASILKHPNCPGIYFDDSGTERVRVPFLPFEAANAEPITIIQIDADDGSPALVVGVTGNDVAHVNNSPKSCAAVDGTTMHLLYAHNTDLDLYHDQADTPQDAGDWGTDTEFKDAATINRISCNVINRSGQKLAMVYNDGGTVMYDEKDIGTAITEGEILAATTPFFGIVPFSQPIMIGF